MRTFPPPTTALAGDSAVSLGLHLFHGPYVTVGDERREIPVGSRRVVVLTALHHPSVDRHFAAGRLWPDGDDQRAAGNLRSALWRLRGAGVDIMSCDSSVLSVRERVLVDAQLAGEWARRLIDGSWTAADLGLMPWLEDALDLLPGWYDDWVIIARERLRQRILHATEQLSRRLREAGRSAESVEAAMMAVAADPLRESAQRVLIEAHLAECNLGEARRAFELYRRIVRCELGVEPSSALAELVARPAEPGPRAR
ncbi:AfsR/SARP family transcriptional regulator [Nocardia goodfellowii]|uniref:DNA-binding SARP family transcriptional activator n=1 Tax=Nocardia goodfellowii TaxID=882446 RepID=A0ABS4QMP7_9NOCA|nr:BTAD domain-containing putative transcriptional regulator [Nocardia goodfellowii]MBP2192977.1 DNA-binding SARP family transcriptional activator [Nocardia goodfellowii]